MQLERDSRAKRAPRVDLASLMTWPLLSERTLMLTAGRAELCLETQVWDGLDEIARWEGRPVADLCEQLDAVRSPEVSLETALRTFVLHYLRDVERM